MTMVFKQDVRDSDPRWITLTNENRQLMKSSNEKLPIDPLQTVSLVLFNVFGRYFFLSFISNDFTEASIVL